MNTNGHTLITRWNIYGYVELGDELYKTVESNNWEWQLLRTSSTSLPGDIYCRCDIYVEIPDSKQATYFILKFTQAKLVEKLNNV